MPTMTPPAIHLSALLTHTPCQFEPANLAAEQLLDIPVTGVTSDSREVEAGTVFVALVGERTDGHQFIQQAIDHDAAAVVLLADKADDCNALTLDVPVFACENTYEALGWLASGLYGHPGQQLPMVGVTGTNGKTTVTHLVAAMLSAEGHQPGLLGTMGVKVGSGALETTSHTTLMAPQLHQTLAHMQDNGASHVVMEVSSHALDQHRVAGCQYQVAIHTNITQDHLDYHRTMANYAAAKAKLFSGLTAGDVTQPTAVFNADDEWVGTLQKHCSPTANQVTYGIHTDGVTYRASNITYSLRGTTFTLDTPQETVAVQTKLAGEFGVYNALAAIAAAQALGVPLSTCLRVLETTTGVRGRFERVADEPVVIVDYAHTPDGLKNVLKTAQAILPEGSRLITVFGCGGDRDATKRPTMGAIAARLSDVIVVTSDNPRTEDPQQIVTDILHGIEQFDPAWMHVQVDRKLAIHQALQLAKPNDMVVVAGKGHEDYQILGNQTIHFDDKEVVQAALLAV